MNKHLDLLVKPLGADLRTKPDHKSRFMI